MSTPHIQLLLDRALALAHDVDGQELPADPRIYSDTSVYTLRTLERAANLARHAAEELTDEMLRARDGWPE